MLHFVTSFFFTLESRDLLVTTVRVTVTDTDKQKNAEEESQPLDTGYGAVDLQQRAGFVEFRLTVVRECFCCQV
jgi:hypothetical protein